MIAILIDLFIQIVYLVIYPLIYLFANLFIDWSWGPKVLGAHAKTGILSRNLPASPGTFREAFRKTNWHLPLTNWHLPLAN